MTCHTRHLLCLAVLLTTQLLSGIQYTATAQGTVPNRDFHGIECSGPVPADLRKSLEQLYMEDKQRVRDYTGGKLSNRDKVLNSSYYITRLMASGRILYGDPVTEMLNRIVDTLLADQPALRKEIRLYSVKSSDVNAFATGQGMLFVNLGLVAQVQDEAQLAFVLSHEIVHYVRKHNLESLTRKTGTRDTTEKGLNDFLRYHSRSREMENEADSLGITLFYGDSPYDKRVCEGFFDVLQYGYLPFDEVEFDTTQFITPWFRLSKGSFLDEVDPISARDDYNDSLSTHPNLLKRRIATTRIMSQMQGGAHYVVTKAEEFSNLQTLARMECIRQDIIHAEYASAYYNCYVMLRQQPENEYLRLAKAQALYGASKFRTYSAASNITNYRDKEGSVQQVYHFMRRTRPAELCMAAIRELWSTRKELNGDTRINDMVADLMYDLGAKHNFRVDQFATTTDTASVTTDTASSGNQKYSNVRRRRRQQQNTEAFRFAFADIMQSDSEFLPMLEESMNGHGVQRKQNSTTSNGSVFLYPTSYYVYNSKREELKIKRSVDGKQRLADAVIAANKAGGMRTVDFSDVTKLPNGSASSYNDFMRLNEWAGEFWQTDGNVPMLFSTQPSMDMLMQRYKADKLSLAGGVNLESYYKTVHPLVAIMGISLIVTAPLIIFGITANREASLLHTMLVDTRTGQILSNGKASVHTSDSKAFLNSQAYAITSQDLHPGKAPGYLGKHAVVTLNGGLSFPVLNRPFREGTDLIALRGGAGVEYAVGGHSSLTLSADFGKTAFSIVHEAAADASIGTFALSYRHYIGDNIAPLGAYAGGGLSMNHVKLIPEQGQTLTYLSKSAMVAALHLELGRNYIFHDRIVLNIGAKYNLTLANPLEKIDAAWDYYGYKVNARRSFNANLWMYNLIVMQIGIGFLPF